MRNVSEPAINKLDSGNRMAPMVQIDSQLSGQGRSGESSGGWYSQKKPWSTLEDAVLREYVNKHGARKWKNVQKHWGLARCAKSCRQRWVNHLKSNLNKEDFTLAEEQKIVELHAKMGNKWACIAAEMEGRTDNDIKNFWKARMKRIQRNGLPQYAEQIQSDVSDESLQYPLPGGFNVRNNNLVQSPGTSIPPGCIVTSNNDILDPLLPQSIQSGCILPSNNGFLNSMLPQPQVFEDNVLVQFPNTSIRSDCIWNSNNNFLEILLPQSIQPDCILTNNNDLLDSLLPQSHMLEDSDQQPLLGLAASSLFDKTPMISCSYSDELISSDNISYGATLPNSLCPDAFSEADWRANCYEISKDHYLLNEPITPFENWWRDDEADTSLLGENLWSEDKEMASGGNS